MANDAIVQLKQITKIYNTEQNVYALKDIDLEIKRRESVAVMGPSGSGKSTLLNIICGLDTPSSGSLLFDGVDISTMSDDECTRLRRKKIGMIFQTFNLLPTLTALENISLTLRLQGLSRKISEAKAGEMLERVSLTHRASHLPDEMSGGERQRVAIARALVFNPPLLLADEPTGNLDSHTGESILKLLDELKAEGETTIVLVTHNDLAASHCERILTLLDGNIVSDEKPIQYTAGVN